EGRRGEAAEEAEEGDEDGVAPDRERHGERGDNEHRPEDDRGRGEVPERMRREEGRVEDGDAGAVERVRGELVAARHAHLAGGDERGPRGQADARPQPRLDPAVLHGVAEEEDRREDERHAANPREELDADERLPVEGSAAVPGGWPRGVPPRWGGW